jgi:hypothetical protein
MQPLTLSDIIDPPCPGHRTSQPLHGALATAVQLLESVIGHPQDTPRWRTPSAGGIYPYEVFLATEDAPRMLAHVDLHRRVVTTSADTAAAMTDADRFLFALCGRPWLSMRAYGRRGFLYHMIDLGHALFNVSLLCGGNETEATRGVKHFASAVGAVSPTAQIACIDQVTVGATYPDSGGWRHDVVHTGAVLPHRTEYETAHTRALNTATRERLRRPAGSHVQGLRSLIEHRKSAKRFQASAEADGRIAQLLEKLPEQILTNAAELGLPVSSIRVLTPEVRANLLPTVRDATAALAQQESLAHARAYVLFGMDQHRDKSIDRGVRRQLLSIGTASELIYLEAARTGTAVTGVGAIDPRVWRQITGIGTPLYLVALGVPTDESGPTSPRPEKLDRLNVVA